MSFGCLSCDPYIIRVFSFNLAVVALRLRLRCESAYSSHKSVVNYTTISVGEESLKCAMSVIRIECREISLVSLDNKHTRATE